MDYHIPVLADECIAQLQVRPQGIYVDATFGGGGHSRLLLDALGPEARLFGFDQDPSAADNVPADERFTFIAANFRALRNYLRLYGVTHIDGLLADLGVSSHQFDVAERGFSYRYDAPLDMRMQQEGGRTAAEVLNTTSAEALQQIFSAYGELRNARTLAQAIEAARQQQPLETIGQLLSLVDPLIRGPRHRYLAQLFQAIRIEVNDEMGALKELLVQSTELLRTGGRLVVLSYHSLEDRMVKNTLRFGDPQGQQLQDFYGKIYRPYSLITRRPIVPNADEIARNSRARSAKLRVGERTDDTRTNYTTKSD